MKKEGGGWRSKVEGRRSKVGEWGMVKFFWVLEESNMETISNSKGQILIPAKIRKQLGIKDGTYLHIEVDAVTRKIILTPITREYIRGLRGKYKGKGLMQALMEEKRRERGQIFSY